MPEKYHIESSPVPPRLPRVGKFGVIDFNEDCSKCHSCVKDACIYDRHRNEMDYISNLSDVDSLFFDCNGCFSCIQECTKGLLRMAINPAYERLGNWYWTPDIIRTTWLQAETAKIPVSGSGYGGPFTGHGFDSMWTDMSEIVRPTRDGIHGREYISTAVDIGKKPSYLNFNNKNLAEKLPPQATVPMPLIIDINPPEYQLSGLDTLKIEAAKRAGLISLIDSGNLECIDGKDDTYLSHCALHVKQGSSEPPDSIVGKTRLIEFEDDTSVMERIVNYGKRYPDLVTAVRVELWENGVERAVELAEQGVGVLHVTADYNGNEIGEKKPLFIKDMLRNLHGIFKDKGIRDKVTIIAGGGIALPEHMAKAVICGADLVSVNLPLMIALECHLCHTCNPELYCPAKLTAIDFDYGAGRMTNLIAAWHGQLIEVMGAMGMREVRRLRGETGRAMFFEEIEEETFGSIFGTRKT